MTFCLSSHISRLPITETKLIYYCTYLARRSIAHQSIQVYISGISFHGVLYGFPFQVASMNTLYLVLRGIRRSQGNSLTRIRRAPITLSQMDGIRRYLELHFSSHDRSMIWSAVTMAFFGLLRSAEYTLPTPSRWSDNTLTFMDISLCHNKVLINIRSSKTDQFRQGTIIRLFRIPSPLCPVRAV